jgi:hypothetical protein
MVCIQRKQKLQPNNHYNDIVHEKDVTIPQFRAFPSWSDRYRQVEYGLLF